MAAAPRPALSVCVHCNTATTGALYSTFETVVNDSITNLCPAAQRSVAIGSLALAV